MEQLKHHGWENPLICPVFYIHAFYIRHATQVAADGSVTGTGQRVSLLTPSRLSSPPRLMPPERRCLCYVVIIIIIIIITMFIE